jgi:hypothetical protein
MQYLYHVLSLREPVFIRPAELGGIQQVFFIKSNTYESEDSQKRTFSTDSLGPKSKMEAGFPDAVRMGSRKSKKEL